MNGPALAIWMLLMVAAFWFLLVRPQRRRMLYMRELQSALTIGDRVVTTSGIFGEIRAIDDNAVDLEVAPGVVVRLARGAIGSKQSATASDDTAPDTGTPED